ncbi:hypothetical protein VFPBJ_11480 [Purpureocillium lilacinum]|uniref:Uncharacterized protein n=1 Tax=Purpureocillium lilacinum TaxID=33203 RepID=A0A179F772_PURLI|nr:hypothetical protein VFPBJ_11480 [Purpureocillium lilacinum]
MMATAPEVSSTSPGRLLGQIFHSASMRLCDMEAPGSVICHLRKAAMEYDFVEAETHQGPILISQALLPTSLDETARIYGCQTVSKDNAQSTPNQQHFSFFVNANSFPFFVDPESVQPAYTALSPALPHPISTTMAGVQSVPSIEHRRSKFPHLCNVEFSSYGSIFR